MRGVILATLMVLASSLTTYNFPFGATIDGLDYRPRELFPGVAGDVITWEIFFFRERPHHLQAGYKGLDFHPLRNPAFRVQHQLSYLLQHDPHPYL